MANTKNKTRENRKSAKRDSRRALKARIGGLSNKERKTFRKFEGTATAYFREADAKSEEGSQG